MDVQRPHGQANQLRDCDCTGTVVLAAVDDLGYQWIHIIWVLISVTFVAFIISTAKPQSAHAGLQNAKAI